MPILLTSKQKQMLFDWQEAIRHQEGELGTFTYEIKTSGGLGTEIKVTSDLTGDTLDLTDVDSW